MGGDYSRRRFDPKKDYSSVLMQQGRVQLDADWNEFMEIGDRRTRAETCDTLGRCVVPKETPEGFRIHVSGGKFTIGRGRIYVDGLLAENHGTGAPDFDPVLRELRGKDPVAYDEQRYYKKTIHQVESLPQGGPHLVYIDVWQREVTYLETPDLIEQAVGVDTTTRLQTVWQVKVLTLPSGFNVTCTTVDDHIAGWPDVIRPSAGRLSTEAVGVPVDEDPCELEPTGGYRGLENQLYRVEIHDGGIPGTATFKWSRDNGTVATAVSAIHGTKLTVGRTGRDSVLRFNPGDWVEITDDRREFGGKAGEIRKIKNVVDATQSIELESALPAADFPTDAQGKLKPERHTRIRRWDQKGQVRDTNGNLIIDLDDPGSTGLIPVKPDTPIPLENGVQITFSTEPDGGKFRVGDYWVFAARTADATVEELEKAPPIGIHHHYGRLAVVTFPNKEEDCRDFWPPSCDKGEGCSTVVIHPGENIQAALDALPEQGGYVCLKTGVHDIASPIRIEKSNVILHGESPGTMVRRSNGVNLLMVWPATQKLISNVTVEGIRFSYTTKQESIQDELPVILFMDQCSNGRVRNCELRVDSPKPLEIMGLYLQRSNDIEIEKNLFYRPIYGVWADRGRGMGVLSIAENRITGPTIPLGPQRLPAGHYGVMVRDDASMTCRIERNTIKNHLIGMDLQEVADRSIIADNDILRAPSGVQGEDRKIYGIYVAAAHCLVKGNYLNLTEPSQGGIRVTGPYSRIEDNDLQSEVREAKEEIPLGILMGTEKEAIKEVPDYGVVKGNKLSGLLDGIRVNGGEITLQGIQLLQNRILGLEEARLGGAVAIRRSKGTVVAQNWIRGGGFGIQLNHGMESQVLENRLSACGFGIVGWYENQMNVSGNSIQNMRYYGIGLDQCHAVRVAHNRVAWCGYGPPPENWVRFIPLFGVGFLNVSEASVESCEILETGSSGDRKTISQDWTSGILALYGRDFLVHGNKILGSVDLGPNIKHHSVLLFAEGSARVLDNTMSGIGFPNLVSLPAEYNINGYSLRGRFGNILFSNNQCQHLKAEMSGNEKTEATVRLAGDYLSVVSNQVAADNKKCKSFLFEFEGDA